ncbi:hypothetical protein D5H75_16385 [Bailinhaonella thermotolerans]|uniref:Uncharacterized protein n=1 Tax=Bailinhaonella thermotolerans TaxID=1070861 RepID=A0A3A4BLW6_9ACTN|nr:hypothetical protein D5H75_16385 [Bailinhaonella thermotolerans]
MQHPAGQYPEGQYPALSGHPAQLAEPADRPGKAGKAAKDPAHTGWGVRPAQAPPPAEAPQPRTPEAPRPPQAHVQWQEPEQAQWQPPQQPSQPQQPPHSVQSPRPRSQTYQEIDTKGGIDTLQAMLEEAKKNPETVIIYGPPQGKDKTREVYAIDNRDPEKEDYISPKLLKDLFTTAFGQIGQIFNGKSDNQRVDDRRAARMAGGGGGEESSSKSTFYYYEAPGFPAQGPTPRGAAKPDEADRYLDAVFNGISSKFR